MPDKYLKNNIAIYSFIRFLITFKLLSNQLLVKFFTKSMDKACFFNIVKKTEFHTITNKLTLYSNINLHKLITKYILKEVEISFFSS